MARPPLTPAMRRFIDDELMRAPLLAEQAADGASDSLHKAMGTLPPLAATLARDVLQALLQYRDRLGPPFVRSLREQMDQGPAPERPAHAPAPVIRLDSLSLVEEDAVEVDVELSHMIAEIRNIAEHELRELRAFVAALAGDMDVSTDHMPCRPEHYARAMWATIQALPVAKRSQIALMRHASAPMARVLRQHFAATCSRLESSGVEPANFRTMVMAGRTRRAGSVITTFSPELHQIRENMPAREAREAQAAPAGYRSPTRSGVPPVREPWTEVARSAPERGDRQAVELVSRLFEAMLTDERVPADVQALVARLHGPAMRLTLRDPAVLDKNSHPLWRFIHLFAFEAEMMPDTSDPERAGLLRLVTQIVDTLVADLNQRASLYRGATRQLEEYLRVRLERRVAGASTQIGALQKLEDRLIGADAPAAAETGMLDTSQMDTVPAELLSSMQAKAPTEKTTAEQWVASLQQGSWVRMFFNLRWVHAQLLWRGAQEEIWLFGDGASDATWAVRRSALLRMHESHLAKVLKMRSLVGSAAARVHAQVSAQAPAPASAQSDSTKATRGTDVPGTPVSVH